jgi:hypothetical protein
VGDRQPEQPPYPGQQPPHQPWPESPYQQPGQPPYGPPHQQPYQQPGQSPHQQPYQQPGQGTYGQQQPEAYGAAPHESDASGSAELQPEHGDQPTPAASPADGQDWRPGDDKFGVSTKQGFDPAFHHKALGDQFAPGVHDPDGSFQAKERAMADRLEQEGWRVDGRPEDHTKQRLKNPECMVRKNPADEGLITEFKALDSGEVGAVKRNVKKAAKQVPPDGEVVLDGRKVGLTEENVAEAFAGLQRFGDSVAATTHVILGDGRMVTYKLYTKEN